MRGKRDHAQPKRNHKMQTYINPTITLGDDITCSDLLLFLSFSGLTKSVVIIREGDGMPFPGIQISGEVRVPDTSPLRSILEKQIQLSREPGGTRVVTRSTIRRIIGIGSDYGAAIISLGPPIGGYLDQLDAAENAIVKMVFDAVKPCEGTRVMVGAYHPANTLRELQSIRVKYANSYMSGHLTEIMNVDSVTSIGVCPSSNDMAIAVVKGQGYEWWTFDIAGGINLLDPDERWAIQWPITSIDISKTGAIAMITQQEHGSQVFVDQVGSGALARVTGYDAIQPERVQFVPSGLLYLFGSATFTVVDVMQAGVREDAEIFAAPSPHFIGFTNESADYAVFVGDDGELGNLVDFDQFMDQQAAA